MAKSNFSALVEAKKQRTQNAVEETSDVLSLEENNAKSLEENNSKITNESSQIETNNTTSETKNSSTQNSNASRETVRRSYRIRTDHDKAVKVMSKFLKQGTEEEIVLKIFDYYFENSTEGKKAVQMVSLIEQS